MGTTGESNARTARQRLSKTNWREVLRRRPFSRRKPPLSDTARLQKRLPESRDACPRDGASRLNLGSAGPADPTDWIDGLPSNARSAR